MTQNCEEDCWSKSALLVAVVELDTDDNNETAKSLHKLRVNRCSYPKGDLSAQDLYRELQTAHSTWNLADSAAPPLLLENIQVYDSSLEDYQPLGDVKDGIIRRFGLRLRIRIITPATTNDAPTLAIAGRYYEFDGTLDISGHRITIAQDSNLLNAGTAINVWDGAILLARYLELNPHVVRGRVVLELGAGCGLAGIAAAVLGAQEVVLTDLPSCLPRLQRNIDLNQRVACRMTCRACDWYNPGKDLPQTPDVILVADCVWMQELVEPLFSTLRQYTKSSKTQVLIAYQRRGKGTDQAFWAALSSLFGTVEELQAPSAELSKPDVFYLLSCRR